MSSMFWLHDIQKFSCSDADGVVLKNDLCFDAILEGACCDCTTVSSSAKYTGDAPTVAFELWIHWGDAPDELLYRSLDYVIGSPTEIRHQQWRVPPIFDSRLKLRVCFAIPEGTELTLTDFHGCHEPPSREWHGGVRYNSHLGFYGLAPFNTMAAYELAARCGYPACIVNPRITKDGVFVCLHDETINDTARDENGNPPSEPLYVCDMTYDELLSWDFGVHKSRLFRGARIPRLSDFFLLCAKTGMRPMFSTHLKMSVDSWKQIRLMLQTYKLLHLFHIKSFKLDILEDAYSVFGDDIEGYTWDEGNSEQFKAGKLGSSTSRLVIERLPDRTTEAVIRADRAAGFETAVYEMGRCCAEEYRKFLELGVCEFTEDYHCSMGLNW